MKGPDVAARSSVFDRWAAGSPPARLIPLANVIRRRLGGATSPWERAESTEILAQEETEQAPFIRHLPGQLERATAGVPGHSSLADALAGLSRDTLVHAPVIRYIFNNVVVHKFGFDFVGGTYSIDKSNLFRIFDRIETFSERASYCNTGASRRYFGHWLHDACPTAVLADMNEALLLEQRADWRHVGFYCNAFSLRPEADEVRLVRKLTVYQDFSQGSSKRVRYAELQRRLQTHLPSRAQSEPRLVYLSRGQTGTRRVIANEDRLIEALERRGFACIRTEDAEIKETIQALRGAEVVVSMEGSHINHAYFALRLGAAVITLIPHDRFTLIHPFLSHAFGMRPGFLTLPSGRGKDGRDYVVDADDVMRTIDLF